MAKLVDMKRSKAEKKADEKNMSVGIGGRDDYPYETHLHLDHEMLGKLGIDKLPKVGDKMHVQAHAHVTEVSEEDREGGKKRRHVRLQMRKMAVEPAKAKTGEVPDAAASGAKAAMDKALSDNED